MGVDLGTLLLVLAFLVVSGLVIGLLGRRIDAPRRHEFGEFTASRGWQYVPSDRRLTEVLYGRRSVRCRHFITGYHRGHRIRVFEVEEYLFPTDVRARRHWIASVTELPAALPNLAVGERTRPVRRRRQRRDWHEVVIPDEQFQWRFEVVAKDPALATEVLHPGMVAMLLGWSDIPIWGLHPMMLFVRSEGSLDLALIERRLDQACAIFDAIPERVWRRAAGVGEGQA